MSVELYEFQNQYLAGLPGKQIFAADTGCFAAGTPVLTPYGFREIETLQAGDFVRTFNGDKVQTSTIQFTQKTSNQPKPMIEFRYDGTTKPIRATYDHPFYDGNRYRPLYQLAWGDMAVSQRLQLQLLCEQYGQTFDYTSIRGVTHSDNETWERPIWAFANSDERQDSQSTPSSSTDMAAKPQKPTVYQPQGLQPSQQSSGQSGMVQPETEQPACMAQRAINEIPCRSDSSKKEVQRPIDINDMGVVGLKYRRHAANRLAYSPAAIHRVVGIAPDYTYISSKDHATEAVEISSVKVLEAEPYYALGINEIHTYIVADLPVHNTGKTFMALAHYDRHAYPAPLLILAPASKIQTGDWERDMQLYFEGRVLPEYKIYSYEKFSRAPSAKSGQMAVWKQWLLDHPSGFGVIADEVHKAKNPQSGIGKRVFEVGRQASFFVGLSATPLPNGWEDAINYFKLFGFTKNKTAFEKHYVDKVNYRGFPEIRGYWHLGDLQRKWNSIAKPLDKSLALDLPPMTFIPVRLQSGPSYIKVQKERLFGDKFLDNPSALMHALRQSIIEPKVKWLDDFLESVSDNCVIFYNYKEERDQILTMIKKNHKGRVVFRQDGEKHEVPSKEVWPRLSRTITLAQYQSGSTGIELTYAATTIYFSPTYSYSNYEQSIGRTNRNGQRQKMTFYMLCAPTTLEKDVWDALRNKKDFQESQWIREQRKEYA